MSVPASSPPHAGLVLRIGATLAIIGIRNFIAFAITLAPIGGRAVISFVSVPLPPTPERKDPGKCLG